MARRIRMTLAYDGAGFHGWQAQPGLPTIQGTLEEIISGIEGEPVHVAASGRTDAGVHAQAQVAAVTITNPIPIENFIRAVNRLLPPSIRLLAGELASPDFHPRFDAIAKTYEYRIVRSPVCSPFDWPWVYHHPYPLDEDAMVGAARRLEGEHDFTVYAAADESDAMRPNKIRTILESRLERAGDRLIYRVRGNGFLKHMVRNIVGTLIEVGRGNVAPQSLPLVDKCGSTAPAKGLTLMSVEYRTE